MTRVRHALALVALAALVAGAGCQGLVPGDTTTGPGPTETTGGDGARPDPSSDVIGWEDGYWHNESIEVDQSDGLSDAEMRAYVGRAMARVEYVREREFQSRVPVEVISRSDYVNRTQSGETDETFAAWNNQVWEALFVVGEDENVQDLLSSTLGSAVVGFYSPGDDEIKIITETPDRPVLDNATLVHELVHAMQDQYVDLTRSKFSGANQDADLAVRSVIEGEANYVEHQYNQRCGAEWSCVETPARGGGGGAPPNWGITLTLYFPYSDGPVYVDQLLAEGGWDAVSAAFEDLPNSSEQIIHATDEAPVEVAVDDRARNGWERFPQGTDTVGEASIYVMFWYQSRTYDAGVVDWREIGRVDSSLDSYDYRSQPSAGWAGDTVVPYRNDGEHGYVWKTRWDTADDAAQFHAAYVEVLEAHDARQVDDHTWVVDDGPYADAFRVVRQNRTVLIVNAPAVEDLDDIYPNPGGSAPVESSGEGASGFDVVGTVVAVTLVAAVLAAAAGVSLALRD